MEDLVSEILSGSALGIVGIIGYFLKKVLNDVEKLKNMDLKNALLEQRVESSEEKIEEQQQKIAKQEVQNTEFKIWLTKIDEKLDLLIKDRK